MINEELFSLLSPVREALNCDAITTDEAALTLVDLIGAHLQESGILPRETQSGPHRDRAIICLTERLRWLKNDMRHKRSSDLMTSVRLHNKALHAAKRDSLCHSTVRQERSFHRNPWKFAQAASRPSETVSPKFLVEQCL